MGSVTVWRDGRKRSIKIKQTSTGKTDKGEAEAILHQIEARYRRQNIENRDAPKSFSGLVEAYLDAGKSERFLYKVVERLGDLTSDDLTQALVDKIGREVYPDASDATLRRQWHGVISAVLNHSKEKIQFERPKSGKSRKDWCTPMQAARLIEEVKNSDRTTLKHVALAEFLFGTGCRSGEAVEITLNDIDLHYGLATFRDTKNGEERSTPLPARVIKAIQEAMLADANTGYDRPFFTKPNGEPYQHDDRGAKLTFLSNAGKRAGLKKFNPHMARHSYATWFLSQTADKRFLREFGGWKSDSIVDTYAHFVPKKVGIDAKKYGWDFQKMIENPLEYPGEGEESA